MNCSERRQYCSSLSFDEDRSFHTACSDVLLGWHGKAFSVVDLNEIWMIMLRKIGRFRHLYLYFLLFV